MILDILENSHKYFSLHEGFEKAFNFLTRPDLKELPLESYKIDSDIVYAMLSKDHGRRKEDALLETHERYIDIQLVLEGTDNMGWKPGSSCIKPSGKYNQEKDVQFFSDEPETWLATKSGSFAIFFPEDAHMPMISSAIIHKAVIKVLVI